MDTFAEFLRWIGFLIMCVGLLLFCFWISPYVNQGFNFVVSNWGLLPISAGALAVGWLVFYLGEWVSPYVPKKKKM